jgi:hypothetical protein
MRIDIYIDEWRDGQIDRQSGRQTDMRVGGWRDRYTNRR